mmetsp:Transcript_70483/g.188095  ORF Transcript_70483/g.188095 Transcript_70483/m.188095 type:complete len:150 (+) Transcript_70483:502-951(+)
MLNLLIAMMSRTFGQDSEDTQQIWFFPFANLVLQYERMLSQKNLKSYRTGVPERMSGSERPETALLGEKRHFLMDIIEVEIGEDVEVGRHARAKEAAYQRHRAVIDVVLERAERLLDVRLQVKAAPWAARSSQGNHGNTFCVRLVKFWS